MRRNQVGHVRWFLRIAAALLALTGSVTWSQETPSESIAPDTNNSVFETSAETPPDKSGSSPASKSPPLGLTSSGQFVIGLSAAAIVGAVGICCVFLLVGEIGKGNVAGVETHWGGFGGAGSGWRLSPALIYLIVALVFIVCATVLALKVLEVSKAADPVAIHANTAS